MRGELPGRSSASRAHGAGARAAAALAAAATIARADAFAPADRGWEGGSELVDLARETLGSGRVLVDAELDWSKLSPRDALLIVHPRQEVDDVDLAAFLAAGGRVAIVDDYGAGDRILERFRIERVPAPARPAAMLRENPALPLASPPSERVAGRTAATHPVVARVETLVLNHPTALRQPKLAPVLTVPAEGEPDAVVALAGVVGQGRLFAMSDPSTLTNQMLRYPGNRAFGEGLARWLVDDDEGERRGGALHVLANGFGERGSFGERETFGAELAARLKEGGRALAGLLSSGLPGPLALALAFAAAVGFASHAITAASRPYQRLVPRFARRTPLFAQGGVAGRAALLAGDGASSALAVLELEAALEEALVARVGPVDRRSIDALLRRVREERALDDEGQRALKRVLSTMREVEGRVNEGAPARVEARDVERLARSVEALLGALEAGPRARAEDPT